MIWLEGTIFVEDWIFSSQDVTPLTNILKNYRFLDICHKDNSSQSQVSLILSNQNLITISPWYKNLEGVFTKNPPPPIWGIASSYPECFILQFINTAVFLLHCDKEEIIQMKNTLQNNKLTKHSKYSKIQSGQVHLPMQTI